MPVRKHIFVTVGTTEFESLIKEITRPETLSVLSRLGFTDVTLQIGRGSYEPKDVSTPCVGEGGDTKQPNVSYFRLKDSIKEDIDNADLVISHAGAGSVLDCLSAGKRLLVVVNDELMGNHQTELAEKLAELNHLHYCVVSDLVSSLLTLSWDSIKPFPRGQPEKLVEHLNKCVGFT